MKNTFVTEIKVPKSKRKSATAILKRMEALIATAEPEDLERTVPLLMVGQ